MRTKKHNGTFFIMDDDYDYTTEIDKAVKKGDYKTAANLERSRNAKIDYLGMPYEQTNKYQDYLTPDTSVASPARSDTDYNNNMVRTLAAINGMNFKYDPKKDSIYKSMKEQAKATVGDVIADTMGTYSGMTGGMPSSYAVSAATQAGTQHLGRPDEMIPELYQLAYNKFANDKADLYKQYGIYADLENMRYARERDAIADQRYATEWQYGVDRDKAADLKYDTEWQYGVDKDTKNADLAAKDSAYNRVMDYINAGMLPSQADIDASGYFPAGTTAQELLDNRNNAVKSDLAMQAAYAPRSGGSSGDVVVNGLSVEDMQPIISIMSKFDAIDSDKTSKSKVGSGPRDFLKYDLPELTLSEGSDPEKALKDLILQKQRKRNLDVEEIRIIWEEFFGYSNPEWLDDYVDVPAGYDDKVGGKKSEHQGIMLKSDLKKWEDEI